MKFKGIIYNFFGYLATIAMVIGAYLGYAHKASDTISFSLVAGSLLIMILHNRHLKQKKRSET